MSKIVEVRFTGIVGLVPQSRWSRYRVVVQNAQKAHHPHVAYLIVEEDGVLEKPSWWGPIAREPQPGTRVAYPLSGWEVSYDNDIVSGALATKADFFRFVLPLANGCHDVYGAAARIDGKYLRVQDRNLVSARFTIDAGTLDAAYVDPIFQGRWDSGSSNWWWFAQEIENIFEIDENELVLRLDGEQDAVVRISSKGNSPIRLLVGNTTKEDIFPEKPSDEAEDVHVRLFFDLSAIEYPAQHRFSLKRRKAPVELKKPPQKKREKSSDPVKTLRAGGGNCPPGLWSE